MQTHSFIIIIIFLAGRARNFSSKSEKSKTSESRIDALSSKKSLGWDVSVSPDGRNILKFKNGKYTI